MQTFSTILAGTGKDLAYLYGKFLLDKGFVDKAPEIDQFPGDFPSSPQLVKADIEVNSYLYDWFATGYYLPAGVEATIKVCFLLMFL